MERRHSQSIRENGASSNARLSAISFLRPELRGLPLRRDRDVLGAGKVRSDAKEARRRKTGEMGRASFGPNWDRTEEERKVCLALEQISKEVGTESITAGELPL